MKLVLFENCISKAVLLFLSMVSIEVTVVAQSENWCAHSLVEERAALQYPELKTLRTRFYASMDSIRKAGKPSQGNEKNLVYKVPVVFHVLHNGGVENISDAQIMDAFHILNRDFRRLNNDANNVQSTFQGLPADIEIEFVLASIAPNGACFNGITRTQSPYSFMGDNGQDQVDAVVAGNDVYQGIWPHNKYLNIYVCGSLISGAAGYTWIPFTDDAPNSPNMLFNGIFMRYDYTGSIETSTPTKSRSLTHELGHWLGLDHTWGPAGYNIGDPNNCNVDDGIQDTPLCRGASSCNLTMNSCNDTNDPNDWSSWAFDVIDNVENYMEYSFCSKMFTNGQRDRMRSVIESSNAGRNNIWSSTNLAEVAPSYFLCEAQIGASDAVVCLNEMITFTDLSYPYSSQRNWSFENGSIQVATDLVVDVSWNQPGFYQVILNATDGVNTDNDTITIQVVSTIGSISYYEDFESTNALTSSLNWSVYQDDTLGWVLNPDYGNSGNHSIWINNFNQSTINQYSTIESAVIDMNALNAEQEGTFSFRYAYKKKQTSSQDVLKVYFSSDCGETWTLKRTMSAAILSDGNIEPLEWFPNDSSSWQIEHLSVNPMFWTPDFKFKIEFKSGIGNNLFVDDINIYAGPPSETIVGVSDLEKPVQNVQVYPNPAEDELHLFFASTTFFEGSVCIRDFSGRKLQYQNLHVHEGNNSFSINTSTLSAGFYFVNLTNHQSGAVFQQPFMVK